MNERRLAVVTGILLILGLATSLLATGLTDAVVRSDGILGQIAGNESQILLATFLQLVTGLGAAGIAVSLYPVLKNYYPGLAAGSIAFRAIEGVFYVIAGLGLIALLTLRHGVESEGELAAQVIVDVRDAAYFVFGVAAFGVGATLYYIAFYFTRLVPRWLTVWGIAGMALIVVTAVATLFDGAPYGVIGNMQFLAIPIALQELVLAVWLIIRGYQRVAVSPSPSSSDRR